MIHVVQGLLFCKGEFDMISDTLHVVCLWVPSYMQKYCVEVMLVVCTIHRNLPKL